MKCDNFLQKISLSNKQKAINQLFKEKGLTDEILKRQIEVNMKRNELNIPDSSEVNTENGGYVQ